MKINPKFISSKNLYHVVKKRNLNQNELSSYLITHPEFNRLIGALPYDWLKAASGNDRKILSDNIAAAFSEFAQAICDIHTRRTFEVIRGATLRFKKFQRILEQKLKEILQREDIEVNYTGSGSFKHCHKIKVGDYDYALSTFINNEGWVSEKYSNYFNECFQGKGYEPQNIFTSYKNGEHGRWAKPFFSRVAGLDDTDGFILSKFITKSRTEKSSQGIFERKHLRVKNYDYARRNTIRGVSVDAGGSVINDNFIENSELRNHWLGLARVFDNMNEIVENYKYRRLDNLIANDIKNNIDVFNKNYLKRYVLSPSQKRIMSIILRNLKSVRKLKNNAEQKGVLDDVKNILNKDLQEEYPYYKELWDEQDKYYSKSFAVLLGISNKVEFKELLLKYEYLPFFELKKDYSQSEIIEGMIQSWQHISKKRNLLKRLCKDFSIDSTQYDYIKKEGRAAINRKKAAS